MKVVRKSYWTKLLPNIPIYISANRKSFNVRILEHILSLITHCIHCKICKENISIHGWNKARGNVFKNHFWQLSYIPLTFCSTFCCPPINYDDTMKSCILTSQIYMYTIRSIDLPHIDMARMFWNRRRKIVNWN